jgi:hypothetical protein
VILEQSGKFFFKRVFSFPRRFCLGMPTPLNFAKFKDLRSGPFGHSVQDSHGYLLIS